MPGVYSVRASTTATFTQLNNPHNSRTTYNPHSGNASPSMKYDIESRTEKGINSVCNSESDQVNCALTSYAGDLVLMD